MISATLPYEHGAIPNINRWSIIQSMMWIRCFFRYDKFISDHNISYSSRPL